MDKRMIAPVIVTVILVIYFLFWLLGCYVMPDMPVMVKLIGGVIPISLIGVSVFILGERIKEIKSGEEDDLNKY